MSNFEKTYHSFPDKHGDSAGDVDACEADDLDITSSANAPTSHCEAFTHKNQHDDEENH